MINATGAWSPRLAKMIGVDMPTYPIRHEICSSEPLKPFLRPMVSRAVERAVLQPVDARRDRRRRDRFPATRRRTRWARRSSFWRPTRAGSCGSCRSSATSRSCASGPARTINHPTATRSSARLPGHPDFFLACGFVGHGFMMAPIVGKLYAEWLDRRAPSTRSSSATRCGGSPTAGASARQRRFQHRLGDT